MQEAIDDLGAAATLAAAESVVRSRRSVEVDDLHVVLHWADLHAAEPRGAHDARVWAGDDRLVQIGGDGSPMVQELCLPELAVARGVHTLSLRSTMADAFDLRHRLPRVWARVVALEADVWLARKVASMSRHLDRPRLLDQVSHLLANAQVILKPVVDLSSEVSVNSYEFPESVKERTHLRSPGEVFPHANLLSRKVDLDHPVPWDPGGPPDQTRDDNCAPLGRTHHRAKTHLGCRVTQTARNEYVWRKPHGLHRVVDSRGTHRIDESQASALTGDDPLDRALVRLLLQARSGALC